GPEGDALGNVHGQPTGPTSTESRRHATLHGSACFVEARHPRGCACVRVDGAPTLGRPGVSGATNVGTDHVSILPVVGHRADRARAGTWRLPVRAVRTHVARGRPQASGEDCRVPGAPAGKRAAQNQERQLTTKLPSG